MCFDISLSLSDSLKKKKKINGKVASGEDELKKVAGKIPWSLGDKNLKEGMPRMKGPRNYSGSLLGPLQINQTKITLTEAKTRPQASAALA